MRFLLLIIVTGCAHDIVIPVFANSKKCVTPCGMVSENYQGECKDIDEYEHRAVVAFSEDNFSQSSPVCEALAGYHLVFVDGENGTFETARHKWARGATDYSSKLILLGTVRAIPHEVAHVLDRNSGASQEQSAKHAGWRERGYCFSIKISSGLDVQCEQD